MISGVNVETLRAVAVKGKRSFRTRCAYRTIVAMEKPRRFKDSVILSRVGVKKSHMYNRRFKIEFSFDGFTRSEISPVVGYTNCAVIVHRCGKVEEMCLRG